MLVENGTCGPTIFHVSGLGQSLRAPVFKIVGIGFHFIFQQAFFRFRQFLYQSESEILGVFRFRLVKELSESENSLGSWTCRKIKWEPIPTILKTGARKDWPYWKRFEDLSVAHSQQQEWDQPLRTKNWLFYFYRTRIFPFCCHRLLRYQELKLSEISHTPYF